jgi:hypothetical protein
MNGILGSAVLEVAIGMALLYLLLALFCTTVNEWIDGIFGMRSSMLKKAIGQLLANQAGTPRPAAQAAAAGAGAAPAAAPAPAPDFVTQFYEHPIVAKMMGESGRHFSYLPARSFATAVMDLVTPGTQGRIQIADLENGIKSLPDGSVKRALLAAIQNAGDNLAVAQKNIEGWFDDTMARVSGWYKRFTQKCTIVMALLFAIAINADTLHIARTLWMDPTLRAQLVEQAKARAAQPSPTGSSTLPSAEEKTLAAFVGWSADLPGDTASWFQRIMGWLLTAIAVSLGAPFWFDTLNRVMNLRNAGKSPD